MKRLLRIYAGWFGLVLLISFLPMPRLIRAATIEVISTADDGPGTLRQALRDAVEGDTITFQPTSFPSGSPQTILLQSELPVLDRNNITIDASNAYVVLDGRNAGASGNGLIIAADNCIIRGLTIQQFDNTGITIIAGASGNIIGGDRSIGSGPNGQGNLIVANGTSGIDIHGSGADNNLIHGNYIGIDVTGQFAYGNRYNGVAIWQGARNNIVGGTTVAQRNVISGNIQNGVWIANPGTSGNQVIGNYLGTRRDGMGAVPNGPGTPPNSTRYSGVAIQDRASSNRVGNNITGAGNLISGNDGDGVYISDVGTSDNLILGNIIGANVSGTQAIGQGFNGVTLAKGASNNRIGDGTALGRNLISGNPQDGVQIVDPGTSGNRVLGNYIGSNLAGNQPLPNLLHGVEIRLQASNNIIGQPGQGNLLSGNLNHGLVLTSGASGNIVQDNLIGPDQSGTFALGNHYFGGIDIAEGADRNRIGGLNPGEGNVIAGNQLDGIALFDNTGNGTDNNEILGNWIGIARDNSTSIPNGGYGVALFLNIDGTRIQNNRIAHNRNHGIWVALATNTQIISNSIYANLGDGVRIDRCAANTVSQGTIYDNEGRGISSACPGQITISELQAGASERIAGITTPNARVEIFADDEDDGRVFVAATTADASGAFAYAVGGQFPAPNLMLTSTDTAGNTSLSVPVHLQWTMLLYLNGDNDLKQDLSNTIRDILAGGASRQANVLALFDGDGPADTILYDVTNGVATQLITGERNMGDAATLVQFVNDGRARYPARHTLLTIVDHGGGWAPGEETYENIGLPGRSRAWLSGGSGLSWDHTNDYDYLSNAEMRTALAEISAHGGPLDVLFYDVCLMGMIEVAYQIKDYARYFISSQNIGWSPADDQGQGRYVRTIANLPPLATPRQMAEILVQAYADSMPPEEHPYTVSALDLTGLDAVVSAINQLVTALVPQLSTPQQAEALRTIYQRTQKTDYDANLQIEPSTDGIVDLYDLAVQIEAGYAEPAIVTAARSVRTALENALVRDRHKSGRPWMLDNSPDYYWDLENLHGLSIFLPLGQDLKFQPPPVQVTQTPTGSLRVRDTYICADLQFVCDTQWHTLINAYYAIIEIPEGATRGPVTALLQLDTTAPTTLITVTQEPGDNQRRRVEWQSSDTQSGIATVEIRYRSPLGAWIVLESAATSSGTISVPVVGLCDDIAVTAIDGAGNRERIRPAINAIVACEMRLPVVHNAPAP